MRNTQSTEHGVLHFKVKSATNMKHGDIAVVDTKTGAGKGYLEFGSSALGLEPVGVVHTPCDNTLGGHGARTCAVTSHCEDLLYVLDNSTDSDLLTQADIMSTVYITGRSSVGKTDGSSTRSAFGKLVAILPNSKVACRMKPMGSV